MEKQQLFETEPARWELKRLERQGKYISVMIDSADEKVYQSLPDDLKADVLPIRLERLSLTFFANIP